MDDEPLAPAERDAVRLAAQLCSDTSLDVGLLAGVACSVEPAVVWVGLVHWDDGVAAAAVAANRFAPPEALVLLGADRSLAVRTALAGNGSTPVVLLARLARDRSVASVVARNRTAPWSVRRCAAVTARRGADRWRQAPVAALYRDRDDGRYPRGGRHGSA